MTAASLLTPEEIKIIELLRPSDGTIRALWQDHDGNQIMMVQWSKGYLEEQQERVNRTADLITEQELANMTMDKPESIFEKEIRKEFEKGHKPVEDSSQVTENEVHYCEQHRRYEYNE